MKHDNAAANWYFRITLGLISLHLALLLAALPDYRVSIDAGYHVALARQYGENFVYFWDTLHYQPAGRPNLRGPAVHFVMGMLGRALGGDGDDYVTANAWLGIACWLAAATTVFFFATRYGSARAALLAVAVFVGSAWASASYYVNLPSGWVFVLTPWAIHLFLRRRLWAAALVTAIACYAHLGGFGTTPIGILAAALLARRYRDLVRVGLAVTVLTAPYWIHFLRSLPWYVGKAGGEMWLVDWLLALFWVVGFLYLVRSPRRYAFLLAWIIAPLAWLLQNPNRFILQSSLAGATAGAVALDAFLDRVPGLRLKHAVTAGLVVIATFFPLGPPSLGAEVTWLFAPYPRRLDWDEMRRTAQVIRDHKLEQRLTNGLGATAVAVWTDLRIEGGPWQRVRPANDGTDRIGMGERNYIVSVPSDDPELLAWQDRGWLRVPGGGKWSSVITLTRPPTTAEAQTELDRARTRDASWIAENCEHNTLGDWFSLFRDVREIPRRRKVRGACRTRVARLHVVTLLGAHARERASPEQARRLRACADGLRALSSIVGSEHTLDYRNATWHAEMRLAMAQFAASTEGDVQRRLGVLIRHIRSGRQGRFDFMNSSGPEQACIAP